MNTNTRMTRRRALMGAAASSVALAVPAAASPTCDVLASVPVPGSLEAEVAMMDAARQFQNTTMAIDPTITGMWIYTDMVDNPGAIGGLHLERGGTFAKSQPPIYAEVERLASALVEAIEDETHAFLASDGSDAAQVLTDAAVDRVNAVAQKLLDLPAVANGIPKYQMALALNHRRWLIMEGSYADFYDRAECRLVDAALAGCSFDNVNMLWHIKGAFRPNRPSDAELQAGWAEA